MPDDKHFVFVERQKALQLAESCGLGIVKEEAYLVGYQVYIIEQWVCDRRIASNTIKVFTGDQSHKIKVCVISISTADLQHPRPEVQSFFDTTTPLKFKSTTLGEIMLTDPSELPYDMDMVLVPDGDYDRWINQAYVNINLRRTNCTGRSALNLNKPNPASEEKFRSIYKIADAVSFETAVINLVKVAQIALYLFNLLKKDYIDGLICNETTKALWEFYTKYNPHKSPEYQLKEPWLEPHLLAALISKLVVCRNKLHAYNFTTIKDPFADYEHFRFDIEEYQRVKNLKRTKFIDLETLDKLNEYTVSQLKVRKVIKSKLDDISGVSNSPLFSETADPDIFRHHATIESLRAIWRPRLKSLSSDAEKHQHEFLHMIKGVGARTTRTSGAAAEIISKFAGSLPWVETRQSHSRTGSKTHVSDSHSNASASSPLRGSVSPAYPTMSSVQLTTTDPSGVSTVEDILYAPPRQDLDRSGIDTSSSSDDELYSDSYRSESDIPSWPLGPEHIGGHAEPSISPKEAPGYAPIERTHIRPDSSSPVSDFSHAGFVRSTRPHRIPRRSRSVSDSIVPSSAFSPDHHVSPVRPKRFILHRANSLATIPAYHGSDSNDLASDSGESSPPLRPSVTMDVQTYLVYERLQRQHTALRKLYSELQKMASLYEHRAAQLRATYIRRAAEFEQIERAARHAIEEQEDTERRLKEVEDGSAKLHYELNVLNDHLKDVEDNVSTFYGKVGLLEQKMQDSQQSITTMLIIGNYFNYYWQKMKRWVGYYD